MASLREQLREQQDGAVALRQRVEEVTQQKVAALMRLSDAEGGRSRAGGRIEQLEQASRRESTAMGARSLPAAAAPFQPPCLTLPCLSLSARRRSLPSLPACLQECSTLRQQLDQAKHEKLEALMKLAAAGGGASGSPGRNDSAKDAAASLLARSPPVRGWWSSPVKGAAS